jgi:hypothetical protein
VLNLHARVRSAGFSTDQVIVAMENQHYRFASAALSVVGTRRLWEVYLFEQFGVGARMLHPSEWRSRYGLNARGKDKKKEAKKLLESMLHAPGGRVLLASHSAGVKIGEDESEAGLMALSFFEV